jgi:hypothetical protein
MIIITTTTIIIMYIFFVNLWGPSTNKKQSFSSLMTLVPRTKQASKEANNFFIFLPMSRCLVYNSTGLSNLLIIFFKFFAQHFVQDLDYLIPQLQASFYVCAHIQLTL